MSARSARPAVMSMRLDAPRLRPARPGDADGPGAAGELASGGLAAVSLGAAWRRRARTPLDCRHAGAPARERGGLLLAERGDRRGRRARSPGALVTYRSRDRRSRSTSCPRSSARCRRWRTGRRARSIVNVLATFPRSAAAGWRERSWPRPSGGPRGARAEPDRRRPQPRGAAGSTRPSASSRRRGSRWSRRTGPARARPGC